MCKKVLKISYLKILLGICVVLVVIKFAVQRSSVVQRSSSRVHNPRMDDARRHIASLEGHNSPITGQVPVGPSRDKRIKDTKGAVGYDPDKRGYLLDQEREVQGEALKQEAELQKGAQKNCTYFNSSSPLPQVGEHTCSDNGCSEYLDSVDWAKYKFCTSKALHFHRMPVTCKTILSLSGKCHFMNGVGRAPVALVSFPGSGNTWIRGLLEQATGICTGSQYCDTSIRGAGFAGEGLQSGSVLVTKTHYHREVSWTDIDKPVRNSEKFPTYSSAVFIIRNPFDAFVADWQRYASKRINKLNDSFHVDVLNHTYFGTYPAWVKYVETKATIWRTFFLSWVLPARKMHRPLHVVRYEDMKEDTLGEVKKILDFLGMQYSADQVKKNLEQGFNTFKRKKRAEFAHYTPGQKSLIRDSIAKSLIYLRKNNDGITYGIESYTK